MAKALGTSTPHYGGSLLHAPMWNSDRASAAARRSNSSIRPLAVVSTPKAAVMAVRVFLPGVLA